MLTVVLAGLRGRWASFLGGFSALALGVGLVAVMGLGLSATVGAARERAPVRFTSSPLVVQGQDRLSVEVRRGPGRGSHRRRSTVHSLWTPNCCASFGPGGR
ncbi:hypothetical protein [Streptomyces sp. NPDC048623]|uniref:hypothetical protein n=1 Tax=Streptomyces sp. NPDC048623 TaxID=3155761 RepID=UPI00342BB8B7